jgi:ribose transport system substrate-binding protein
LLLLAGFPVQGAEQARPTYTVGFAQDTLANDWRAAQVRALQHEFAKHPHIRLLVTDGQGQTAKQIQDIEDLVLQKIDLLITSPRDELAMTPIIEQVHRQGIPVVLITRKIAGDGYTILVAPDDLAIAREAAHLMARRLNGKGRIVMLRGIPTATTAKTRTAGFREAIRDYPDIRIVAERDGNYLRGDALKAMDELITRGVAFDGIYAQSDSMASGARVAIEKAGLDPARMVIVGIDYIGEARDAIRAGTQTASFTYPACAVETVDAALRLLEHKPVPKRIFVKSELVTRENVESVEPNF